MVGQMSVPGKLMVDERPIRFVSSERLDFNHFGPLRKSYIVASSIRSGSEYLCWSLWQTGVLGAPTEVFNPTGDLPILMNRFKATSPADYVAKLVAHRSSRNGVFGMKAHFHHFEAFLSEYPALLEVLSPLTYIYITRHDKVAQAVSMAKALQTCWWTSRVEEGPRPPLRYDREMIAQCLADAELQDLNWRRWFEAHNVTPFQVTYDALTADAAGVVRSIVELLGVQNDARDQVSAPPAKKQGDETNQEWIERFQRETQDFGERRLADAGAAKADAFVKDAGSELPSIGRHFFDRHNGLIKSIPAGQAFATGFFDVIRLRRRYDAIVGLNRDLFQNARVLDIMSLYGFWSLAALDAGAVHVVGVDASGKLVEAARKNFTDASVKSGSYKFIHSEILAALKTFRPGQFDVIVCKEFFEQCYFPQIFFHHLARLRPKHVILDTRIAAGKGPMARFSVTAGHNRAIISTPNHDLIAFLCAPDFRWRLSDWQALGITDWTGIQDYARNTHRTYVLDRL